MKRYLSHDELFELCRHRWYEILLALMPDYELMQKAVNKSEQGKFAECPLESPRERKGKFRFRVNPELGTAFCYVCGTFKTGFALLMEANGWDYPKTASEIRKHLGLSEYAEDAIVVAQQLPKPKPREPQTDEDELKRPTLERGMNEWRNDCYPLTHELSDPVRRYLIITRGLVGLDFSAYPTLRCHPRLAYYDEDGDLVGYFPAMVALIQAPDGRVVGFHRTYLTSDGNKAPVPTVKKTVRFRYRSLDGAAIRLGRAGLMLGASEGIENALSVVLGTGMTMWAARAADALASLEVPSIVNHMVGWGDLDELKHRKNGTVFEPGRDAAEALLRRMLMEGRATDLFIPDPKLLGKKADWNDVWRRFGVKGFPQQVYRPGHLPSLSSFVLPLEIAA